MTTAAA